ncbi:hypothetical protein CDD81_6932 [Ophiocordyceps australis]|uniref:2EXR domain-containing protein n=1 Tax=Ophiocordyceps australis TaxID=1399860 RepID=A0A2C5Y4D5_9HYPO|nr:hypothetical protein CDD81_6932 [Ophiocordyceps australis]
MHDLHAPCSPSSPLCCSNHFLQTQPPQSPPTPRAQFHLFPLLPPELRLRIWNLNLPRSRLVPIRCGSESLSLDASRLSLDASTTGCVSDAPIPVNLHVCSESRIEAQKTYHGAFGFARAPGRIMFNPGTDALMFGPRKGYMASYSQFQTCMSMCSPAQLAQVRRLAISDALFWSDSLYRSMTAAGLTFDVIKQLAQRMPRLEHIVFVPRQEDESSDLKAVRERIAHQVQIAMALVGKQVLSWREPNWEVLDQSSLLEKWG